MKEFVIDGVVSMDADMTEEEFRDAFIAWVESNDWYFGGGVNGYSED